MALDFEWDRRKAARNHSKHGVSFDEASTAFSDPLSITIPDPDHSSWREQRSLLLGQTYSGKLVVVSHTERGDKIRLISARTADRRERRTYEEET